MIKKVLTYPEDEDILSQISEKTTPEECKELIQNLKDTLATDPNGAGLSAIQIGEAKRVCIINYNNKITTMINPIITWKRSGPSGIKEFKEGCLSVPGKYVMVARPQKVICEFLDEKGEQQAIADGGWMSAIIQHELDHMDGICKVHELTKGV